MVEKEKAVRSKIQALLLILVSLLVIGGTLLASSHRLGVSRPGGEPLKPVDCCPGKTCC
jgi:hypothetical protein